MRTPNSIAVALIISLAVIQSVLQALTQQTGALGVDPHAAAWITLVLSSVAIGIGVGLHYLPSPTQTATNMNLKAENENLKAQAPAVLEAIVQHSGPAIHIPEQQPPTPVVEAVGTPQGSTFRPSPEVPHGV